MGVNLYEINWILQKLSNKADTIKSLDRDTYKSCSDLEIIDAVLEEKIERLKKQ